MILWVVLFILIIAISFVLAFRSMKDYQEIPQQGKAEYGLFLIRKPSGFNTMFLDELLIKTKGVNLIVSIERLFKDKKSALLLFAPKNILQNFFDQLDLIELEDYTPSLSVKDTVVWEVGFKKNIPNEIMPNIFSAFPDLLGNDQFFWQVILGGKRTQIRAVLYSEDPARLQMLATALQQLGIPMLHKVPLPFSNEQMLQFFKSRSTSREDGKIFLPQEIIHLIQI